MKFPVGLSPATIPFASSVDSAMSANCGTNRDPAGKKPGKNGEVNLKLGRDDELEVEDDVALLSLLTVLENPPSLESELGVLFEVG